MTTQGLAQLSNQRWFHWRNDFSERCPPFGCIGVYGTEVDKGRLVFWGTTPAERIYREPIIIGGSEFYVGMGWNMCFNSAESVQPGEIGRCTFDIPAWCLLVPVTGYGSVRNASNFQNGLVSYDNYQGWALSDVHQDQPSGDHSPLRDLMPGLQIITACSVYDLNDSLPVWELAYLSARGFYVGLIGGMTHYFRGQYLENGQ